LVSPTPYSDDASQTGHLLDRQGRRSTPPTQAAIKLELRYDDLGDMAQEANQSDAQRQGVRSKERERRGSYPGAAPHRDQEPNWSFLMLLSRICTEYP